jgi:Uma2 family endonuclease
MQWQDVLADKSLHDLPYKIELNEKGLIEMSPASFIHSLLQGRLTKLLGNQLDGEVFTELAVQTSKGIRVPDVAWGSKEYVQKHIKDVYALAAPELCVEIISPSNTREEMIDKVELFLEAGAKEVWLVTEDGQITYHNHQGQQIRSIFNIDLKGLTPEFST